MNNLYLIEGENEFLIQSEIAKITADKKNIDIIKYDLENINIEKVIETLDTYDMFLRKKVVLAYNPPFYQNVIDDFNLEIFLKYLQNPSDNILVLITDKVNSKLKVVKNTISYFNHIKVQEINLNNFIKSNLGQFRMDNLTIKYFIETVGNNYNIIINELTKLKDYSNQIITKNDIDAVCRKNYENTIFDLIDAILKKNKKKSYDLYNYFLGNGSEVFGILILLANQIRLIYNVKVLKNLSDSEIAGILNVKEYPVKLARTKGINYSKGELLNLLYNLGNIDESLKSGKALSNISLISFIMQM